MLTLIPAYGRDYKTKEAALADFHANKDFMVVGFHAGARERPTNENDLRLLGTAEVNLRYAARRKCVLAIIKPKD